MLVITPRADGLDGVPPQPLLARERLIALVERPYQASVTTIVAGPGSGKSTLAWQWAAQSPKRVSWLTLDPADGDISRFRTRLLGTVLAAARNVPHQDYSFSGAIEDGYSLDAVLAEVAASDQDACLVLDNCHLLADPRCTGLLTEFVTRLPANLCVVLISRQHLPLRLARLRSQGWVRDIVDADLRFTEAEATSMIGLYASPAPPLDRIRELWASTQGWITGMKFSGLALVQPLAVDGTGPESPVSGEGFLDEYMLEEVLEPLPADLRDFVYGTSGLPFLSPSLCDAALGIAGSEEILAHLASSLPFFGPEANRPDWYRYEPLFAASLRRLAHGAVPEPTVRGRHQRAADWLLADGDLDAAAGLALQSGDRQTIVHTYEALCRSLADRSDLETMGMWLDRLPGAVIGASPSLPYWMIISRLGLGQTVGMKDLIDEIEPRWLASGEPLPAGRAHLCRGMLAFFEGNAHDARHRLTASLRTLPAAAHVERLYAATFLGKLAFRQGRDQAASEIMDEATAHAAHLPLDERWSWLVIAADRANGYALRGDLFSAITKYRLMLSELPAYIRGVEGFLRCRLVNLAIERDDLDTAHREYETVKRLLDDDGGPWRHDAAIANMRLLLAEGQRDEAEAWGSSCVKELRRLPQKEQIVLLLARIWLERGELSLVRSWLRDMGTPTYPWVKEFGDLNQDLLAVDFHLAQGEYRQAAQVSQDLADEAAAMRRRSEYIEFAVRSAIAQHELGNVERGIEILRPAIRTGARGGFVRAFDIRGFNIVALFQDLWGENREVLEVKSNLQRLRQPLLDNPSSALTRREFEVLRLVSEGMSNKQIAGTLFISVNTVRNHLVRICRRLDANSRTEVVARARHAGILD